MRLYRPIAFLALLTLAGPAAAGPSERPYGDVNGWNVAVQLNGTQFDGCTATHHQLDGMAMIGLSADGNWLLAFEMPTPQGIIPTTMRIDGRVWHFEATGQDHRVSFGPSLQMMDAVRAGSQLTIALQGSDFTTTLTGSSAAMTLLQTCVNRRGG